MPAPIFIGDEVSAVGYRLAGARVRTPDQNEIGLELERAAQSAELIIITQDFLDILPDTERFTWMSRTRPLLVVVPDLRSKLSVEEMTDHLRAQLGMLG